jgi:excisionase family DNA binding protein
MQDQPEKEGIMETTNRLISVKDAAQRLGIATITAYRMAEDGRLKSIRLGGRRLIALATIEALIESAIGEKS